MSLYSALRMLVTGWPTIRDGLEEHVRAEVGELVRQANNANRAQLLVDAMTELAWQLRRALPRTHPFAAELADNNLRSGTIAAVDMRAWAHLVEQLTERITPDDDLPTVADVARRATEWLLAASAFSEPELRARGVDTDDPDLVALARPDGTLQWPSFQFTESFTPIEIVRTVNRILSAADDPWGVADWWLGEHAWLPTEPARLVGRISDDELIAAAMSELAEA